MVYMVNCMLGYIEEHGDEIDQQTEGCRGEIQ